MLANLHALLPFQGTKDRETKRRVAELIAYHFSSILFVLLRVHWSTLPIDRSNKLEEKNN